MDKANRIKSTSEEADVEVQAAAEEPAFEDLDNYGDNFEFKPSPDGEEGIEIAVLKSYKQADERLTGNRQVLRYCNELIGTLNQLGVLWSNREQHKRALFYLMNAKSMYEQVTTDRHHTP